MASAPRIRPRARARTTPVTTYPVVMFTVRGQRSQPPVGTTSTRPYTVVYDGTCKVCTRLANVLKRWENGKLEVIPSQAPGVQARYPWIPPQAYTESLQLIGPGGETWQGAAAVEKLLDVLPRGGLVSWLFKVPLARPVADRFYSWFARNRYKLGCGEHCQYRALKVNFDDADS